MSTLACSMLPEPSSVSTVAKPLSPTVPVMIRATFTVALWALRRSCVWRSPELAVDAGGFRVGVGRLAVVVGGRDLEAVVFA